LLRAAADDFRTLPRELLADNARIIIVAAPNGAQRFAFDTQIVANAPPDGYALGFLDTALAINPAIAPSLPYDSKRASRSSISPARLQRCWGSTLSCLPRPSMSGSPRAVQNRLIAAMEKLARMPDLATRMPELGHDPTFIGPPGSGDYVFAEMRKWRKVMQESSVKTN
jgi:hypothetical protein